MFGENINNIKSKLTAWWNFEDTGSPCLLIKVVGNLKSISDTSDLNIVLAKEQKSG